MSRKERRSCYENAAISHVLRLSVIMLQLNPSLEKEFYQCLFITEGGWFPE